MHRGPSAPHRIRRRPKESRENVLLQDVAHTLQTIARPLRPRSRPGPLSDEARKTARPGGERRSRDAQASPASKPDRPGNQAPMRRVSPASKCPSRKVRSSVRPTLIPVGLRRRHRIARRFPRGGYGQFIDPSRSIIRVMPSNDPCELHHRFPAHGDEDLLAIRSEFDQFAEPALGVPQIRDHVTIVVTNQKESTVAPPAGAGRFAPSATF